MTPGRGNGSDEGPVPEEHVPVRVRASFARGGRNSQQIHAAGVSPWVSAPR